MTVNQKKEMMRVERVNPWSRYRLYSQGYPSQAIFRHGTQLFRGCYHMRGRNIIASKAAKAKFASENCLFLHSPENSEIERCLNIT